MATAAMTWFGHRTHRTSESINLNHVETKEVVVRLSVTSRKQFLYLLARVDESM